QSKSSPSTTDSVLPRRRGAMRTYAGAISWPISARRSMPSILQLPLAGVRGQPDGRHADGVDQAGDLADAGVIPLVIGDQGGGGEDGDGRQVAAEVEADAGAGGADAGGEELGQEQRQPAEVDAAEEAQPGDPEEEGLVGRHGEPEGVLGAGQGGQAGQ